VRTCFKVDHQARTPVSKSNKLHEQASFRSPAARVKANAA